MSRMEANNSQSGELFLTVQGYPMTFSLSPLCPERKEIQNIIEMWGGTVTGVAGGLHTIRLVDSQGSGYAMSGSEDVFKLQYIHDCVEAQELLDLKDYRVKPSVYTDEVDVMNILLGNNSWKDAKRLRKDEARRFSRTGDNCDVFVSTSRCRQSYTLQEEKAILQYITQECRFDEVKGKTLWVDMEQAKVCPGRSWGSMKEHFRKYIVHKIEQFNVDPLITKKAHGTMSPGVSKMADIEEAIEKEDDVPIQSELRAEKRISFSDDSVSESQRVVELPQGASMNDCNKENNYSGCEKSISVRKDIMHEQQHFSLVDDEVVFKESRSKNPHINSPEQVKGKVLRVTKKLYTDADMDHTYVFEKTSDNQRGSIDLNQKRASNSYIEEQVDVIRNCQGTHESRDEVPEHTSKNVKSLCNFHGEQSYEDLSKHRNESIFISDLESCHAELDLRSSKCEEKDVTEKFIDETHSCCADEKMTKVDVHESEIKLKNGREQSCSELYECENHENDKTAESINLPVIKSSCTSILCENLVSTPDIDNYEMCIDKTRCTESCQVTSANVPFKQGDEDELEGTPKCLQNTNFAKSGNENFPIVKVGKLSRKPSLELFDLNEVIAKIEKAKESEKLEFLKILELKKRNEEKKSEVQKRRLRNRCVEYHSCKCGECLSGSDLELKSLDKEKERCVQMGKSRNKVHGANMLNISEQGEQSSDESKRNRKHAPQTTHNSLPYEKRGPFRLVHSRYFTREERYCEQSPVRGLKKLRNQIKDLVDIPDSEDSFHRYSVKHEPSHDEEIGVNISSRSRSRDRPSTYRHGSQYTIREDIALLAFIQDCAGYERVGGNQLWKMMEKSGKLKNRTWHSLKERYRKVIMQRLDTYENIESVREAVQRLRGKYKPEKVVKKEPDARKPYSRKEDYLILKFIIENKRYSEVGAKSMWEQMSREQDLRERSWLSLKERFRKVIVRNLNTYKISLKAKYHFSKILNVANHRKRDQP